MLDAGYHPPLTPRRMSDIGIPPVTSPEAPQPPDGTLPDAISALLLAASTRRALVKGQELFGQGSMPQAMYGVVSGSLRIGLTGEDGNEFLATVAGPGQWFGEGPLLDGAERVFRACAMGDAEVAILAATDFQRLVRTHPEALLALARLVCSRYRSALAWIEDANLRPLPARLARRVLALHSQAAREQRGGMRLSQDELAGHLGVSRQSVNRLLKAWERSGHVRLSYGGMEILDPAVLVEIGRSKGT